MTTLSFSSFPPAFESFPDLEPRSSSHPQSTEEREKDGKHREDKKRRSSKERRREPKDEAKDRKRNKKERDERKEKKHAYDEDKITRDEAEHSSKHKKRRTASHHVDHENDGRTASMIENFNRIFYLDQRGDEWNIAYGSLHAGDVPKYRHVARGRRVLGLDPTLSVTYRGSKGVEIGEAGWFNKSPQLSDSRARAMLTSGNTRRLTASTKGLQKYEEVDGFIRVASRKGKEKEQAYRSISLNNEDVSDSDSSSQSGSETSDSDSETSPLSAREEAIRSLEQHLVKDPTLQSKWLILLQQSINGIIPSSKNAELARAEISVAVLERALSAHPSNAHSPLLRLKYLRAGEIAWDMAKLKVEWEKAMRDIDSADLCLEWLEWVMRSTPSFNSVVECAIKATARVAKGADQSADYSKLRILWRVATFFKEAGYIERGFALFQVQAELSFNIPDEVKHSAFENQLDSLEEFWESEVARVGEPGAKTWKVWTTTNKVGDAGRKPRRIDECPSHDPYAIWHFNETESDARLIFPMRMPSIEGNDDAEDEDGTGDDPYATILFSDIRPFLIDLRTASGRDMLRLVWLSYLGLHIPGLSSALSSSELDWDDRWCDTSYLKSSFLQSLFPKSREFRMITADSYTGVIVGREKTYAQSFAAVQSWNLGVRNPLEGVTVDGQYRTWNKGCLSNVDPDIVSVMSRIIKELRHDKDNLSWNITDIAFEAALSPGEKALKHSQALLSENSSSAELLAAHAYLERIRRKFDKARKVYRVGLQSLAQTKDASIVYLWWDFAELEWLLSKSDDALEVVFHAGGQPNERTGISILRARRRLEELCQQNVVAEWRFRLRWIKLRILLEFLVGTLMTAIEVSLRFITSEEPGSLQHESLFTAFLLMVYHHTTTLRNHAPPAVLRDHVRVALDIYPSNSIIIGLFLECEKGEGVWGRVRAFMSENVPGTLQDKSVARRLIEVWIANWEEGRWLGEVERVRAGLEAAVTSDRTRGSAILWKVYVKFEVAAEDLKNAKAVLFRALKECPLVKELYLLAFDVDLRGAYSQRELTDLSDTMAERGIRLRRSLGEVLEMHGSDSQEGESDTDESLKEDKDEQEIESRERRRLMPF